MAPSPEMQTFAGRLASFDGPKQVNKRRASSQKKKQPTSSSWPHESPTPEQLAKAGFFYKPSSSSPDSVTCFLCDKALDGWDVDDNPALEHLNHVPDCGWAINCCIEQRIEDMDRSEEDPHSEKIVEARRATYRDWWPHESKKESTQGKKAATSKKGRTSRTSKTSRQSVQTVSSLTADQSLMQLEEDTMVEEGDSVLSTASRSSRAGKSNKKPTKSRAAATRSKQGKKQASLIAEEPITSQIEAELERELDEPISDVEESRKASKPTRGRKNTRSSTQSLSEKPKPPTVRGRKAAPKTTAASSQDSDIALQEAMDSSNVSIQPQKATRGRKRMSDGSVKRESNSLAESSPPAEPALDEGPQAKKKTRGKGRSKPIVRKSDGLEDTIASSSPKTKQRKNPPKGRGKAKRHQKEEEEMAQAEEEEPEPDDEPIELEAEPEHEPEYEPELGPELESEPNVEIHHDSSNELAEEPPDEPLDEAPSRPLQQATPPPGEHHPHLPSPTPTPQSSNAENEPPSSKPPSSKPATSQRRSPPLVSPPAQHTQTPRTSPSKRNMIEGNQTSKDAWKPVDLESVFLPSPASHVHLANDDGFNIETIIQTLTQSERELTVEDWIKKNAGEAEDRLRRQCERMIGKFEDEGNRALNTMEGIECA
ncbi:MAG: hypothetical protein Q9159_000627 [Coniocarpon cinnabarinum]